MLKQIKKFANPSKNLTKFKDKQIQVYHTKYLIPHHYSLRVNKTPYKQVRSTPSSNDVTRSDAKKSAQREVNIQINVQSELFVDPNLTVFRPIYWVLKYDWFEVFSLDLRTFI